MADDFVTEFLNENVTLTLERFNELTLMETRNYLLQKKVNELLITISELQELLNQRMIVPSKKNKSIINDIHFK
jgi:hypothetical protein